MSRDRDDDFGKGSLICDPHNGSRTPQFNIFKRNFRTVLDSMFMTDDSDSIWQVCEDTDQNGSHPDAERMPSAHQSGYTNAVRREKRRQAKAFVLIYKHIDDERIREMLDAIPASNRRGTQAWALVERECATGSSDLEIADIQLEFQQASIDSLVGHSEDTIIKFSRILNSLNARLPADKRYTEEQLAVKILTNINYPESLALEAVKELRAPAGSRTFERTVTIGGRAVRKRDYQTLVTYFDSVWRGLFKQGVIRPRAPGRRNDAGALALLKCGISVM